MNVKVKIEGFYPNNKLIISLEAKSTLRDLFKKMIYDTNNDIKNFLFSKADCKLQVYSVLVNSNYMQLEKSWNKELEDGDEIMIISPIGGG